MPKIVVISDEKDDGHIPLVARHLRDRDIIIVDPKRLISGECDLTYEFNENTVTAKYKSVNLKSARAVWYRKPAFPPKEELPVPPGYRDYAYTAMKEHFFSLIDILSDAMWVSSYYAVIAASNKLQQLQLAAKLGFRVPETVVTTKPSVAQAFIAKYKTTIVKSQAAHGFSFSTKSGQEKWAFFYATKVRQNQKIDFTNLHLAPSIFQQAVENIAGDIRVAVVGEKAFASFITNPGLSKSIRVRDWRVGHVTGTLHIEPYKLPRAIEAACIAHVKQQGLLFGALDLVIDKHKSIWFLENNPNGQWGFVDDATSDSISEEIAFLLQYGKNRPKTQVRRHR